MVAVKQNSKLPRAILELSFPCTQWALSPLRQEGFCMYVQFSQKKLLQVKLVADDVKTPTHLPGANPGVKRKSRNMKKVCHHGPTNTFTVSTPIGQMLITSCPKGLHCVTQNPETKDSVFQPDKNCKVELQSQLYEDNGYTYTPAIHCIQWLKSYFAQGQVDKMPSLCPSILSEGTFTTKVWLKLPEAATFGQTISYKGLSAAAGSSGAFRAVGQAMATNPIQLIIPCHRVICSDGSTGNYGRGDRNAVKQWLLLFEKGEV